MWRRRLAAVAATISWGLAATDALAHELTFETASSNLILSAAIVATAWLMHSSRNRPLGAAYDLGYEAGLRDAMLAANRSNVIQMRGRQSASARGAQILLDADA